MLSRRAIILSTVCTPVTRALVPAKSSVEFKSSPGACAAPEARRKSWELLKVAYEDRSLRARAASAFYEALSIGDLAEAKSALQILRDLEDSEGPDTSPDIDSESMGEEANLARLLSSCFEI